MFEKATAQVLSKALSAYFVDIDQSVVKTSIWQGNLLLRDVKIHPSIGEGGVEEIEATIPWRSKNEGTTLKIQKLRLRLKQMTPRKPEKIIESKLEHIERLVMFMSTATDFFSKFVKSVLEKLTCHITDMEIRYGDYMACISSVTLGGNLVDKTLKITGFELFWNKEGEQVNIVSTDLDVRLLASASGKSTITCSFNEPIFVNGSLALYSSLTDSWREVESVLREEEMQVRAYAKLEQPSLNFAQYELKDMQNEYEILYSQSLQAMQVSHERLLAITCSFPARLIAKWRIRAQNQSGKIDNIVEYYEFTSDDLDEVDDFDLSALEVTFSLVSAMLSVDELQLSLSCKKASIRGTASADWSLDANLKSVEMFRAEVPRTILQQ